MTVKQQLDYLRSTLGEVENPPFSNHCKEWDRYHANTGAPDYQGSFWCGAEAVNGCYAGGFHAPANFISVEAIRLWGQAHGRFVVGLNGVQPGDLIIFKNDEHVETCEVVVEPGHVQDIGGNTSDHGYNPNGGGSYRNVRSTDVVIGYVRVHDLMGTGVTPPPAIGLPASAPGVLQVDGQLGPMTYRLLQATLNKRGVKPALGVDGAFGPATRANLQRYLGATPDGVVGPATIRLLQHHVAVGVDGVWGSGTTRGLQTSLNKGKF